MKNRKKETDNKNRGIVKPYLTGDAADVQTPVSALKFFGTLVVVFFITFIACSSAVFNSILLRYILNLAVLAVTMMIHFNSGSNHGAEAVSRGEILYAKQERGKEFTDSERKICFHPLKGYLNAMLGTIPFLIPALFLAILTAVQTTESGALPSWMQSYTRRSDIGSALVNYTQPEGMHFIDYIRALIRICILPFVNLVGHSNREGMYILERISPVLILLPALFYGSGYLTGKNIRTKIHTAISENDKNRIRRERKRIRKQNNTTRRREPEQLN